MPSIQITVPNDKGSQKFTIGEIARMILETHESSPAVDAQTVIMKIMKQAEGGEPPVSFRHGIEPPDEEIVFVTAAGHPYKLAASAAKAARTRADLQNIVWETVSVDGGWVIRKIFDYDNWFEYYANKETMTADKIGYMALVSTADMTRFCRSTGYREWASQLGLGVPVMFGGKGAPAAEPRAEVQLDFWTSRQITEFIEIEQAFEEFCGADPVLGKLNSIYPGPKSRKFNEWYAQYCPAHDDATERFLELFREKILVAWVLRDDKEDDDGLKLPSEYWASSVASLTFTNGRTQGLLLDERHKHLANSRAVLRRKDWEKWINETMPDSQHGPQKPAENPPPAQATPTAPFDKKPQRNRKRDVEADAKLKPRIEMVLAKARNTWPDKSKRPGIKPMARELERTHGKELGFKFSTIRKILDGTYRPAERFGIRGL